MDNNKTYMYGEEGDAVRGARIGVDEEDVSPMVKKNVKRSKMKGALKVVQEILFSNLGLLIIIIVFSVWGAEMFIVLETPAERERYEAKVEVAKKISEDFNFLVNEFQRQVGSFKNPSIYDETNITQENFEKYVEEQLHQLSNQIIRGTESNYDGSIEGWTEEWTHTNSLLFVITIMTTVGYGHIYPSTSQGKMFLMIYAMVGIGLMVAFMAKVGNFYGDMLKYMYSRIFCRPCRIVRYKIENQHLRRKDRRQVHQDLVGEEDWMPTDEVMIPITINLVVILGFLMMGAYMYRELEDWDLMSSTYFCFITMTTIGFGDMVPYKSFDITSGNLSSYITTVFAISYLIVGMVVLSMCISLMQDMMAMKASALAKKLGKGKDRISLDVVSVKARKPLKSDSTN